MKDFRLFLALASRTALLPFIGALTLTTIFAQNISAPPTDPTFSDYGQIACHNCYEKKYASRFYDVLNSTTNVEIDFWDAQNPPSGGTKPRHWYVRHNEDAGKSGNDNNCTGDGQGTNDLEACLGDVAQWSKDHPGHNVITVFLDKKQNWGEDRQPVDLDNLIMKKFPSEKILTPGDVIDAPNSPANLRQAIAMGGWRPMSQLKGMFIFVITGGQDDNHNKTQSYYVQKRGQGAICFVAPDTDETSDITGTPNQFNTDTAGYVIFYNIKNGTSNQSSLSQKIHSMRYISRLWGGDDKSCSDFTAQRLNLIALYDYKKTCSGQTNWLLPTP